MTFTQTLTSQNCRKLLAGPFLLFFRWRSLRIDRVRVCSECPRYSFVVRSSYSKQDFQETSIQLEIFHFDQCYISSWPTHSWIFLRRNTRENELIYFWVYFHLNVSRISLRFTREHTDSHVRTHASRVLQIRMWNFFRSKRTQCNSFRSSYQKLTWELRTFPLFLTVFVPRHTDFPVFLFTSSFPSTLPVCRKRFTTFEIMRHGGQTRCGNFFAYRRVAFCKQRWLSPYVRTMSTFSWIV